VREQELVSPASRTHFIRVAHAFLEGIAVVTLHGRSLRPNNELSDGVTSRA
jgi:hypothetical protein